MKIINIIVNGFIRSTYVMWESSFSMHMFFRAVVFSSNQLVFQWATTKGIPTH